MAKVWGYYLSNSNADDDLEESILSINFSNKSSRYICSGGSGRVVRIWDLQRKRCIKWLSGHTDTITGVMYNCKDEHLASISLKGDLILHNLASGARAADFKDPFGEIQRPEKIAMKQLEIEELMHYEKPTACVPYEAPFSSLTYSDDGNILTAGTNGGLVVFYDVRGKPQPFTILHAFSSSEAVTSLCWQRSKPYVVNESNCTSEIALLGGASEDSILMPDPRPSVSTSSFSTVMLSTSRSSQMVSTSGSTASLPSTAEETPIRSSLWRGGSLAKLQAPREADFDVHRLSDWRSSTTSRQDDMLGSQIVSTPVASSKSDSSFSPAPEERVGTAMLEKSSYHQHFLTVSRHLPSASSSTFTSLQDSSSSTIPSTKSVLTNPTFSSLNQQTKAISTNEKPLAYLESSSLTHTTSVSVLLDTKQVTSANFEIPGPLHSSLPRRYTTYADRLITASSIDGISSSIISPKSKKTGSETREELLSTLLSRQDSTAATGNGSLQSINVNILKLCSPFLL
ncbi:hypothetical protein HPP92_020123 [Vanilla planifolia]|uniref:Uncharacterized protein n=1 Tax=Vanilla planifolia TaxID=51239 RepID=A0A835QAB5_VANPL|nr:hypothetical protein HPP92_020123 [Vanilla planifolia]